MKSTTFNAVANDVATLRERREYLNAKIASLIEERDRITRHLDKIAGDKIRELQADPKRGAS